MVDFVPCDLKLQKACWEVLGERGIDNDFLQLDAHSSPLFRNLSILKFPDLVTFHTANFMQKFYNNMLPSIFTNLFTPVNKIHNYNTRLASKSSYALTKTRTNYGLFNFRHQGAIPWNSIDEEFKPLKLHLFKKEMKKIYLFQY